MAEIFQESGDFCLSWQERTLPDVKIPLLLIPVINHKNRYYNNHWQQVHYPNEKKRRKSCS
jgi:hypothetical protein